MTSERSEQDSLPAATPIKGRLDKSPKRVHVSAKLVGGSYGMQAGGKLGAEEFSDESDLRRMILDDERKWTKPQALGTESARLCRVPGANIEVSPTPSHSQHYPVICTSTTYPVHE